MSAVALTKVVLLDVRLAGQEQLRFLNVAFAPGAPAGSVRGDLNAPSAVSVRDRRHAILDAACRRLDAVAGRTG